MVLPRRELRSMCGFNNVSLLFNRKYKGFSGRKGRRLCCVRVIIRILHRNGWGVVKHLTANCTKHCNTFIYPNCIISVNSISLRTTRNTSTTIQYTSTQRTFTNSHKNVLPFLFIPCRHFRYMVYCIYSYL